MMPSYARAAIVLENCRRIAGVLVSTLSGIGIITTMARIARMRGLDGQ